MKNRFLEKRENKIEIVDPLNLRSLWFRKLFMLNDIYVMINSDHLPQVLNCEYFSIVLALTDWVIVAN